jgi:hypothetical protein
MQAGRCSWTALATPIIVSFFLAVKWDALRVRKPVDVEAADEVIQ